MKGLRGSKLRLLQGAALVAAGLASSTASAGFYNDGKVFLTGGVFTVDGAGGGGAVPWATITGYETRDGVNGGIGVTYVTLPNYDLNWIGTAIGFYDRFELSAVDVKLKTNLSNVDTAALATSLLTLENDLGLKANGSPLHMYTLGAKLRLFGDAVYTSDSFIPQTAIGVLYKNNTTGNFVRTLNGAKTKDWEAYLAFTKVFFKYSTLLNVTVRYTAANQIGLTGFGSCNDDRSSCDSKKEFRGEASIAHLLAKNFAIGGEYQQHGNNVSGRNVNVGGLVDGIAGIPVVDTLLKNTVQGLLDTSGLTNKSLVQNESDWFDFFFAYAPNKHYSITLAYLFLGDIAIATEQNGFYISLHATF